LINPGNFAKLNIISEEVMAVNRTENNEQLDADILQCRADILHALNAIQNPTTQNNSGETTLSADTTEISTDEDTSLIPIEEIPAKETAPLPKVVSINKKEETETLREKGEIPSFDLAEEIMAEQRKITAIRRKGPSRKNEAQKLKPETQPVEHIQERVITEIVARDIERLCRGDYSVNSK
jgi:hypothetical protein